MLFQTFKAVEACTGLLSLISCFHRTIEC
jgi:hypothetical protein